MSLFDGSFILASAGALAPAAPDLPAAPATGGATLRVAQDGTGDFATIQAAIDAASAGDTIVVAAGTYDEAVRLAGRDLTLRAEGAVTIANDDAPYGLPITGTRIAVEGIAVEGITRESISGFGATGIAIDGTDIRITDAVVTRCGIAGLLTLESAERVLIEGGRAADNTGAGLALGGGAHMTVRDTVFANTGQMDGPDGTFQQFGRIPCVPQMRPSMPQRQRDETGPS
ncbi:hypothetical protein DLJ49_20085 [Rhodovulum sp. 12E13]|uniref:hypothetical protein n=1 Tax=Rhodovulum sp. 12E13 TaxID=2203891 RepID=UPI000E13D4F3|nr:hypothetical protein [Rhodovulum sp. 12E13]RDC68462.1 hypothetical protein DLJ49_20085 [Rhodovulum sp. 12E13]